MENKHFLSSQLYIGIMSGSSADGVDCALVDLSNNDIKNVANHYVSFPSDIREKIVKLANFKDDSLHNIAKLNVKITRLYADAVRQLLDKTRLSAKEIAAIGCHGQTILHSPSDWYSLQLINGGLLTELTGITTVTDFRNRDIAAGGQGAPLAPLFHDEKFRHPEEHRVILNIGGMANVTNLSPKLTVSGFDTGPGNCLIDAWCEEIQGEPFDNAGSWAREGKVDHSLLVKLKKHPYFAQRPPKSCGREQFNMNWLCTHSLEKINPEDVQATLLRLTTDTISEAICSNFGSFVNVFICGGGARNTYMIQELTRLNDGFALKKIDSLGISADWVEACTFAWLAKKTVHGQVVNAGPITGAKGPKILGCVYQA